MEELLVEWGAEVDHVAGFRRVRRFTPLLADAAPVYPAVLDDLVPWGWQHVERYANNPVGHGVWCRVLPRLSSSTSDGAPIDLS